MIWAVVAGITTAIAIVFAALWMRAVGTIGCQRSEIALQDNLCNRRDYAYQGCASCGHFPYKGDLPGPHGLSFEGRIDDPNGHVVVTCRRCGFAWVKPTVYAQELAEGKP